MIGIKSPKVIEENPNFNEEKEETNEKESINEVEDINMESQENNFELIEKEDNVEKEKNTNESDSFRISTFGNSLLPLSKRPPTRQHSMAEIEINVDDRNHESSRGPPLQQPSVRISDLYYLLFRGESFSKEQLMIWIVALLVSGFFLILVFILENSIGHNNATTSGLLFGSVGTIISCSIVNILFLVVPSYQRHMNAMLFYRSSVDFCLALTFIFQPLWTPDGISHENMTSQSCKWTSVIREYLFVSSFAWGYFFAYDLWILLRNPFTSTRLNRKKYILYSNIVAFLAALALSSDEDFYGISPGGFCWVKGANTKRHGGLFQFALASWLFVFFPILIVLSANILVTFDALKRLHNGLEATMTIRRELVRQGVLTTIAFTFYWLILWGLYCAVWMSNGNSQLENAFGFFLTYRGIVVFGLWILYNRPTSNSSNLETTSSPRVESLDNDDALLRPQANAALQKEIVYFTTAGIQHAVRSAEERYSVNSEQSQPNVSIFTVNAPSDLHEGGSLRHFSNTSRCSMQSDSNPIFQRKSTGERISIKENTLNVTDETGNSINPTPTISPAFVGGSCRLRDYKPSIFHRLRTHFGIVTDLYISSFLSCTHPMISEGASGAFMFFTGDNAYIVKSLTLEERTFLLDILDKYANYVISNPNSFISRFLGCYSMIFYHKECSFVVMENIFDVQEGVKIHQRYDLKGSWVNRNAKKPRKGKEIRCRYCHMSYRHGDNDRCPNRVGLHEPNVVLKDMDLTTKLRLGPTQSIEVLNQLKKDSSFLCDLNIMDYSLLLGVVEVSFRVNPSIACMRDDDGVLPQVISPSNLNSVRSFNSNTSTVNSSPLNGSSFISSEGWSERSSERNALKQSNSGLRPTEMIVGPGFYYIGIIDILQEWNWSKRVERFIKVHILRKDPEGISAIPPIPYRNRFHKKLDEIIFIDHRRQFNQTTLFHPHEKIEEEDEESINQEDPTINSLSISTLKQDEIDEKVSMDEIKMNETRIPMPDTVNKIDDDDDNEA